MKEPNLKLIAAIAFATVLVGGAAPARAQLGTIRLDNWLFYQSNYGDSARWQYRPRLFVPYAFGNGWTLTSRADLPLYYTDAKGPANPDGDWKFRASDFLVEEALDTPEVAKNLRLRGSLRLVFPTGGEPPFGADQWQIVPGAGFNWRLPDAWRGVTISPYARYFHGFDAGSDRLTTKRSWNIFPTVTFGLTEKWSVAFYPEQGLTYNDRTNKWFVPVEAMFSNRVSKGFEYSFGGAYAVVKDDPAYRWVFQSRLTFFY
jgi:hypothetical protein